MDDTLSSLTVVAASNYSRFIFRPLLIDMERKNKKRKNHTKDISFRILTKCMHSGVGRFLPVANSQRQIFIEVSFFFTEA